MSLVSKNCVCTIYNDDKVKVWQSSANNEELLKKCKILYGHMGEISSIVVSPNENAIVTIADDKLIHWDMNTWKGQEIPMVGNARCAVFNKQGKELICCDGSIKILSWEPQTRGNILKIIETDDHVHSVKIIESKNQLLVNSHGNPNINLYDLETGKILKTLEHKSDVVSFCLLDDNIVASCTRDSSTISIWELSSEDCLYEIPNNLPSDVNCEIVAYCKEKNLLVSGHTDGYTNVHIKFQEIRHIPGGSNNKFIFMGPCVDIPTELGIDEIRFLNSGEHVLIEDDEGGMKIVETKTFKIVKTIEYEKTIGSFSIDF